MDDLGRPGNGVCQSLAGGYAQFTYAFNYYGPTGNQRDEVTVIRRRSQNVEY